MALYTNQSGKLKEVKEKPFKLEKDIQKVFEANLSALMGLELVKSEFTIKNNALIRWLMMHRAVLLSSSNTREIKISVWLTRALHT